MMAGTTISVLSVKGGAGSSVIATNLAVSLRRESRGSVALLDLTYPIPGNVPLYLGLQSPKAVSDILTLLDRLQPALLKGYLTMHPSGVTVVPAANDPLQAKLLTPEKLERFTELLIRAYDYVVIDMGTAFVEESVPILDLCDLMCLLMVPDVASVDQARKAVEYLQSYHFSREMMRLVLNRYSNRMPFPPDAIEESLGLSIALYIPDDPDLMEESLSSAEPFVIGLSAPPGQQGHRRVQPTGRRRGRRRPGSIWRTSAPGPRRRPCTSRQRQQGDGVCISLARGRRRREKRSQDSDPP